MSNFLGGNGGHINKHELVLMDPKTGIDKPSTFCVILIVGAFRTGLETNGD